MFQVSLRAARINAGMKQKDAAKGIGVGVTTIINWENGKTAPRSDQLQELCELYKIPIDCVFLQKRYALSEQPLQ